VGMRARTSIKERLSVPESVTLVTDWLAENTGETRTHLARDICRRLDFRDGKGALRIATTLKALRDLETEGYWELPAARSRKGKQWNPRRLTREERQTQ